MLHPLNVFSVSVTFIHQVEEKCSVYVGCSKDSKLIFRKLLFPDSLVLLLTRHLCYYHCVLLKKESNYRIKLQAKAISKLVAMHKVHSAKLLWTVPPLLWWKKLLQRRKSDFHQTTRHTGQLDVECPYRIRVINRNLRLLYCYKKQRCLVFSPWFSI